MEIYIASFAGLLSTLLLGVIYLADRYEREPIELIQLYFLSGLVGQLALILIVNGILPGMVWSGIWILMTVGLVALYLPFQLFRQHEMDERFDGIVYAVALAGGALCVIHLNNLPRVIAESPYRSALAAGNAPDLRDLLILATSPGFLEELGRGLIVIVVAVLIGAAIGFFQFRGWSPVRTSLVSIAVAISATLLDQVAGGNWLLRLALVAVAIATALALKRGSVFRDRPEPLERDVLIMAVRTVLIVFGAVLLATVLLQMVVDRPEDPIDPMSGHRVSREIDTEPNP